MKPKLSKDRTHVFSEELGEWFAPYYMAVSGKGREIVDPGSQTINSA